MAHAIPGGLDDFAAHGGRLLTMAATLDVSVTHLVEASPDRLRRIMFDARQDPTWMAAVKSVELLTEDLRPGARVRRVGKFLGRTLRWTTEVTGVSAAMLDLKIVDGPMRGTVTYRIEPEGAGSRVTIRNVGHAPGFAPRWLLTLAMRRSLTADLRRLKEVVEAQS
jgi:uncharacterized membrane protein